MTSLGRAILLKARLRLAIRGHHSMPKHEVLDDIVDSAVAEVRGGEEGAGSDLVLAEDQERVVWAIARELGRRWPGAHWDVSGLNMTFTIASGGMIYRGLRKSIYK